MEALSQLQISIRQTFVDVISQSGRRVRMPQVSARPLDLARPPDRLARETVPQRMRETRPSNGLQRQH